MMGGQASQVFRPEDRRATKFAKQIEVDDA